MAEITRIYRSIEDLPLVLRVEDLMSLLAVGRNTAYELIRCGAIRNFRVGKQVRIPKDALIEYIAGHGNQFCKSSPQEL